MGRAKTRIGVGPAVAVVLLVTVSAITVNTSHADNTPSATGDVAVLGQATDATSFRLYTYDENRQRTGAIFKRDLNFPASIVGTREAVGLVLVRLPSQETLWLSVSDLKVEGIDVSNFCIETGAGGSRNTMGAGKRECS